MVVVVVIAGAVVVATLVVVGVVVLVTVETAGVVMVVAVVEVVGGVEAAVEFILVSLVRLTVTTCPCSLLCMVSLCDDGFSSSSFFCR